MHLRTPRWLIVPIMLVVLIALVVATGSSRKIFDRAGHHMQRGWMIVTGRLVDVGGYKLHIERLGEGSPTVIMDAGLCATPNTWGRVPSEVARFTRVVIYERAGIGLSDRGPRPRTSQQIATELERLLVKAGISGPYVLVGHSFGGFNVRLYASQHPDDVVGIVLIDTAHEDQFAQFAALKPPGERERFLRHEAGANCEGVDILASGEQVRSATALPPIPLVVLSADTPNDPKWAYAHETNQADLARLTQSGKRMVVKSRHFIQLQQPDVVVNAIAEVVQAARSQSQAQNWDPGKAKMHTDVSK